MGFLTALASYHDYGWFLAGLGWLVIGVGVWLVRTLPVTWRWLPWVATAGVLRASVELVSYTWPVQIRPRVPAYLWAERSLVLCDGLVLIGLWSLLVSPRERWRWGSGAVGLGLAAILSSQDSPLGPGAVLILLAGLLVAVVRRLPPGAARRACLWAGLSVVSTSHGSLAMLMGPARRWVELSQGSFWISLGQTLAVLAVSWELMRVILPTREQRADWIPFMRVCAIWLVGGLAVAAFTSSGARRGFEQSGINRAAMAAALMNRALVAEVLGPDFVIERPQSWTQPNGNVSFNGFSSRMVTPAGREVREELAVIRAANPDVRLVYFLVQRDPWVARVVDINYPLRDPMGVGLGRSTPADAADWEKPQPGFIRPQSTSEGFIGARAPVFSPEGEMVAWLFLGFQTSQWIASQVQARLQTYAIVVLGLGLAALLVAQRIRTREREAARAAEAEAKTADRMKTAFLAKVSHELRTPIQSILGYGELLDPAVTDRVARERLRALRQHGQLMLRLVNDLLDLEALQTGAFRLVNQPARVDEMLRQTVESLRPRAEAKGLRLSCRADHPRLAWVSCDIERVRQVVINLVTNAIKFTRQGKIEVTVAAAGAEHWEIAVRDTGPGIAATDLARLFKPFSRLEATRGEEGTGLGLALAAGLCRSMGGEIQVESRPGQGSTFRASFHGPAAAPMPALEKAARPVGSLVGRRILLADDNGLVRELYQAILIEAGAQVLAVADGEEAMAMAELGTFDGVILDIAMPRLDGLTATSRLRGIGKSWRIVVVSAHAGAEERARALAAGADVFLSKPLESRDLCEALMTAAGTGSAPPIGEEALRAKLTARFREEVSGQWAAVEAAFQGNDANALRRAAHYLKNSASVVRDEALIGACDDLERAAQGLAAPSLARAFQACHRALAAWLPPDSSAGSFESAGL